MIRISQIKMPVVHSRQQLEDRIRHILSIHGDEKIQWTIVRKSLDARRKDQLQYIYTVDVTVSDEKKKAERAGKRGRGKNTYGAVLSLVTPETYSFPAPGKKKLNHRPVIIGSGPAGLFCGWMLAKHGYRPVILEQGDCAATRREKVNQFWESGKLDPDCNVQFGEGGAGTFSDGKLNTGVKDKNHRNQEVLRIFVRCGGPEEILYDAKPHLGTDHLVKIVSSMRKQIEEWGGEVRFRARMTELIWKKKEEEPVLTGIKVAGGEVIETDLCILACGHSARGTFRMLTALPVLLEPKPFAVGLRIEHPQNMINECQYGPDAPGELGAAPYKLAQTLQNRRGVYSFCMCPGGYVVNAASEPEKIAVNGMSYHDRGSANANSAIVVSVHPEDFSAFHQAGDPAVLDGIAFQRAMEAAAFRQGQGLVPVQRLEDFRKNRVGGIGTVNPVHKGGWNCANLRPVLPEYLAASLEEGVAAFDRKIHGFAMDDALFSGVESRTSSPIRITRDPHTFQSSLKGLYPCGEGAGYAGGITSAAMDGIRIAEAVAAEYAPFQ